MKHTNSLHKSILLFVTWWDSLRQVWLLFSRIKCRAFRVLTCCIKYHSYPHISTVPEIEAEIPRCWYKPQRLTELVSMTNGTSCLNRETCPRRLSVSAPCSSLFLPSYSCLYFFQNTSCLARHQLRQLLKPHKHRVVAGVGKDVRAFLRIWDLSSRVLAVLLSAETPSLTHPVREAAASCVSLKDWRGSEEVLMVWESFQQFPPVCLNTPL